jgi:hypothetical protein
VASRPIPAFKKGTKNAPAGLAIVGEEGPELVERNGRMFITPGKASFVNLTGGEKIHTAKETERIIARAEKEAISTRALTGEGQALRSAIRISEIREIKSAQLISDSVKLNQAQMHQAFGDAVRNIPVNATVWDERGIRKRIQQQNSRVTYLNNRLS